MKRIEFLFPELSNIFAESYNIEYLTKCSDEIEIIETRVSETPEFINGKVDMVYLGCLTESGQEKAAKTLNKYKNQISEQIDKGLLFLVTGNAIELFGKHIDCGDNKIKTLGIFDFYAVRKIKEDRHNSHFIGDFESDKGNIEILGHKSQFSFAYDADAEDAMSRIKKGIGMNPETDAEGVRKNNFFATYSLGPFLVQNPYFTKFILRKLGLKDKLCFEKEAIECYEYRLAELNRNME